MRLLQINESVIRNRGNMNILRPYQMDVVTSIKQSFMDKHSKILVCLPCGSGKTVLFSFMAESSQRKRKTIWFLVHRQELLKQTIDTFDKFHIKLITIHIGMVMTYANHLDKYPVPDFIIFDEAHFSMATTWQKIINKFPKAKILGLTATPCRLDGKPLGATYDDLIVGISTKELIAQGYLSPYKYYAPTVADLTGLKRKGSDYDSAQATELLTKRAVFGDVIKNYRQYADGLQSICYCSSVAHSKRMAEEFQLAGIHSVHFDGETSTEERNEIVEKYKSGEITILCNCDLISYGFDCPDCHCCILLRPTMSTALAIQQAGRALRPQDGKTAIILDMVGNYLRHGLPDDDREWSLETSIKPREEYKEDGRLKISQCPECYFTFMSGPSECPNCGAAMKLTRKEIQNIKDIQLQEIKTTNREKAIAIVSDKKTIDECKTLQQIMSWCKLNGKKAGYGYFVARARGYIR